MVIPEDKIRERVMFFQDSFKRKDSLLLSASEVLSLSTKFNKIEQLYIHSKALIPQKIAVLASFTTHYLKMMLKIHLHNYSIVPYFYDDKYDSISMDLLDGKSELFSFKPEVILMLTYHTDIKQYPSLFSTEAEIKACVDNRVKYYQRLWDIAASIEGCSVFQTTFVNPIDRQLGNMEANYLFSKTNYLKSLNMELISNKPSHVYFIDADYLASYFGKGKWFDESNYFISKQGISIDATNLITKVISRLLASRIGKINKCLVLDLDNTIWGGVIGDVGVDGINVNLNDPIGEAYLAFQAYVKDLKNRGVILAVCSKNDEDIAKEPFIHHDNMCLKLDDIACFVANWNDKASNLDNIANILNIGVDSLVFFDDNPVERDIVRQFLPDVTVIDVPDDPGMYVRTLEEAMCFDWLQLSKEDIIRSDSYIQNQKRKALEPFYVDYDSYLRSLEMKAKVGYVGMPEIQRFVQLINKSNQFNLRTKRYSESTVTQMMDDASSYALIYLSLEDKFGSYGIILSLILKKIDTIAFIDTWIMSCRVLKRGIEDVAFNLILNESEKWNCEWIVGEYIPTKKNLLVKNLYPSMGFGLCPSGWSYKGEEIAIVYRKMVAGLCPRPNFIDLI
ncbi:FkbH domain-containing protein [Candidatus Magnetobacterium bavaricum]|uniref:FkbH domain-containing protein n=1 Tax=Candidatus Magnetobacterium bavaricum TaxID=29290 RepID=A0A0F3GX47_9BACT|nr:FkbH domain-containing protein [Candidatus Magnetobacterium bavaricum]